MMVDRILSLEGQTITVESRVPDASPVFEGHFPGYPLMPGVLLVKEAKFRSFVGPGAPLEVTSTLEHDGSGFAVTKARVTSDGKRICDAELTLRIMDFPAPELAQAMRARAVEIGLPGVTA
jgi:3-hydroxyacyl-[acyl-carrier-protein] dehydratase